LKILIDNSGYELKNHGDLAMLVVIASRFHQRYPDAQIQILTVNPTRLKEIIPYAIPIDIDGRKLWSYAWNIIGAVHKIFPLSMHYWLQQQEALFKIKYSNISRRWIERRLRQRNYKVEQMSAFLDVVQQADIVIASGGGYITDSFEGLACNVLQTLALAQSYHKPTAMFGQGLGPVDSKKISFWAGQVLPKLHSLSLREGIYSKKFALESGRELEEIKVTGDDAIGLAYSMKPKNLGRKIGVNLRLASYSGVGNEALERFSFILEEVGKRIGAELCAVPISFHEGDSDYSSLQKILTSKQIKNREQLDTPEKIIQQVGECRIVVTGSYHAGVFALSQGVSVVAIVASNYYRHKFDGLAQQFEVGCQVVDRMAINFNDDLKTAIYKAWEDADLMRPSLLEKAIEQVSLSEEVFNKFADICHK